MAKTTYYGVITITADSTVKSFRTETLDSPPVLPPNGTKSRYIIDQELYNTGRSMQRDLNPGEKLTFDGVSFDVIGGDSFLILDAALSTLQPGQQTDITLTWNGGANGLSGNVTINGKARTLTDGEVVSFTIEVA